MRMLASTLVFGILASCADASERTALTLSGSGYLVPSGHITTLKREPHQFVAIKPADRSFDLIYDSRTAGRSDRLGWPLVTALNDGTGTTERHVSSSVKFICRSATQPWGGCAFGIDHRGVQWTVRFPHDQRSAIADIREQALAVLDGYLVTD